MKRNRKPFYCSMITTWRQESNGIVTSFLCYDVARGIARLKKMAEIARKDNDIVEISVSDLWDMDSKKLYEKEYN